MQMYRKQVSFTERCLLVWGASIRGLTSCNGSSQDIFRKPFASHSNDNMCGGPLSTVFLVDRAGPLVRVMVAPECHVDSVLLQTELGKQERKEVKLFHQQSIPHISIRGRDWQVAWKCTSTVYWVDPYIKLAWDFFRVPKGTTEILD